MSILQRVVRVFHQVFAVNPERVTMQTVPDDVPKWDSLGHMAMVSGLEREFNIQFEVDEIMEMASVAKIVELLGKRGIADA